MITVEGNTDEMPCVPEDLHDMVEEGVELLHGRAMTAVLGNGKVDALQLHPARFTGAINASPIAIDREAPAERFAVDNVIIAVGQHASLGWLPDEFKTERGTIKIDRFGRLGDTNFFAAGDIVQLGSGQPLMVVNAVGDGKRVAFNLDKVLREEPLQPRTIPLDVITDLQRMNMTYFPHFPARAAGAPAAGEPAPDAGRGHSGVHRGAGGGGSQSLLQLRDLQRVRQLLSGLPRAVHHPPRCGRTGSTRFWSTTARAAACASKSVRRAASRACPELDFDSGVVRMDTAFAITQGLHGRQAEELRRVPEMAPKDIENWR